MKYSFHLVSIPLVQYVAQSQPKTLCHVIHTHNSHSLLAEVTGLMSRLSGVSNIGEIVNQLVCCGRPARCCRLEMLLLLHEVCKSHALYQTEDKHFSVLE